MRVMKLLALSAGIALFAGVAFAQPPRPGPRPGGPPGPPRPSLMFQRLDKNHDGKVTKEEVPGQLPERVKEMLKRADKNKDEVVTAEEFRAAIQAVAKRIGEARQAAQRPTHKPAARPAHPPKRPQQPGKHGLRGKKGFPHSKVWAHRFRGRTPYCGHFAHRPIGRGPVYRRPIGAGYGHRPWGYWTHGAPFGPPRFGPPRWMGSRFGWQPAGPPHLGPWGPKFEGRGPWQPHRAGPPSPTRGPRGPQKPGPQDKPKAEK